MTSENKFKTKLFGGIVDYVNLLLVDYNIRSYFVHEKVNLSQRMIKTVCKYSL